MSTIGRTAAALTPGRVGRSMKENGRAASRTAWESSPWLTARCTKAPGSGRSTRRPPRSSKRLHALAGPVPTDGRPDPVATGDALERAGTGSSGTSGPAVDAARQRWRRRFLERARALFVRGRAAGAGAAPRLHNARVEVARGGARRVGAVGRGTVGSGRRARAGAGGGAGGAAAPVTSPVELRRSKRGRRREG